MRGENGHLGQPGERRGDARGVVACFCCQVADGAVRAAVDMITTANSLGGKIRVKISVLFLEF